MKNTRGFTLIELLVVIAIIGILSSVVLASLSTARNKANDAKRQSDLHSLQIAVELYYSKNGTYPVTGAVWSGVASPANGVADYIPGLVADKDISKLPQDPAYPQAPIGAPCNGSWPSMYLYRSDTGTGYLILAHCPANSSVGNTPTSNGLYDPVRPTWAWKVCSGTECGY